MQIIFEDQVDSGYSVKLAGEFDAAGCRQVREQLEAVVDKCGNKMLSMDIRDVSFIDSSGIGAIVFLFKRIRAAGGDLRLTNVHSQPQELLTLLRVHEAITVTPLAPSKVESVA